MSNYVLNRNWEILSLRNRDFIVLNHRNNHLRIKSGNGALGDFLHRLEGGHSTSSILTQLHEKYTHREVSSLNNLINELVGENVLVPSRESTVNTQTPEYERFKTLISWFSSQGNNIDESVVFNKIRNTHITIIGLGGVGSLCAMLFASTGFGKLTLIDGDHVELSNLVRQPFYTEAQAANKTPKTTALKSYLDAFSSYTEIDIINTYLDEQSKIDDILNRGDVVLCTADKPRVVLNRMVNEACVKNNIPALFCMLDQVGPFFVDEQSACFNCLEHAWRIEIGAEYDEIVEALQNNNERIYPSIINGPYLIAYMMFDEVLGLMTDSRPLHSENRLIRINNLGELKSTDIQKLSNCKICSAKL